MAGSLSSRPWKGAVNRPASAPSHRAFQDGGSLADVIAAADIVLSILPPASAPAQADAVAAAMKETGKTPPYADCNAIAPETTKQIGQVISDAGADYIDGGIIGSPPGKSKPPRFYVSGPGAPAMSVFDGKGIVVHQCGPEIGRGSAVKMAYAGITKGTSALHAAMLIAAERLGVGDELFGELQSGQTALYQRMENMTSALPAVSGRYIGEMLEIADTLAACDMPPDFHRGAADLYRLLEKSPFSSERRDTVDKDRTLGRRSKSAPRPASIRRWRNRIGGGHRGRFRGLHIIAAPEITDPIAITAKAQNHAPGSPRPPARSMAKPTAIDPRNPKANPTRPKSVRAAARFSPVATTTMPPAIAPTSPKLVMPWISSNSSTSRYGPAACQPRRPQTTIEASDTARITAFAPEPDSQFRDHQVHRHGDEDR